MPTKANLLVVGVVGPCGSGKSTLIQGLQALHLDLDLHHIAQEHSFAPTMWQRLVHPDFLVFLDASFEVSTRRRRLDWTEADFLEQQRRLSHARLHANLYIMTDPLTPPEIVQLVFQHLKPLLGFSPDFSHL